MEFSHVSVLLQESVDSLVTDAGGTYVDCTLGGSGHAGMVVTKLNKAGRFIGIDQDPAAIQAGRERLAQAVCRVDIIQNNFSQLERILDELEIEAVDGILFDLGVSSHQLDVAERGFSYMQDAPLDMRMNPAAEFSAYHVINEYSESRLAAVIAEFGEERWAKRIAKFIVAARADGKINTTGQLVDIIKSAIPAAARRDGPHPAKRTFQAIRIEVNKELDILKAAFTAAVNRLKIGGRICIITFHSLEDRIAKQTLAELAKGCECPPRFPVCVCNKQPVVKLVGKPISPSAEELDVNPRARSAKLRVAEKV